MVKGSGRFLGRRSRVLGVGGQGLENHVLSSGQLIRADGLPDNGVYEIQGKATRCDYPDCGRQAVRVRRVDMRYLTKSQKQNITDVSSELRGHVAA